jgi:hypothetical protein
MTAAVAVPASDRQGSAADGVIDGVIGEADLRVGR